MVKDPNHTVIDEVMTVSASERTSCAVLLCLSLSPDNGDAQKLGPCESTAKATKPCVKGNMKGRGANIANIATGQKYEIGKLVKEKQNTV